MHRSLCAEMNLGVRQLARAVLRQQQHAFGVRQVGTRVEERVAGVKGGAAAAAAAYDIIQAPGAVSARLAVPEHIEQPAYARSIFAREADMHTTQRRIRPLRDEGVVTKVRAAGKLAAATLQYAGTLVRPGVTTDELDRAVHDYIVAAGAYPSPLGYQGFKKSICTSVNNVIVHGVPDSRPLQEGDIVNIDITVYLNGVHGDNSRTFAVGDVDARGQALIGTAEDALQAAVGVCGPDVPYSEIGRVVEDLVEERGFSVCPYFIGHGIGPAFHCPPAVLHYRNEEPYVMRPGHVFTIEPAVNEGSPEYRILQDGWTAITLDGGRSAQTEHTVLITDKGVEVLTCTEAQ